MNAPVFYSLDATDGDGNYLHFDGGETITAGSSMLPQLGGASAISSYGPHSDPTRWLYSSLGRRLSINPLVSQLLNQPGVPRINPTANPYGFPIQPYNLSWARMLKERSNELLERVHKIRNRLYMHCEIGFPLLISQTFNLHLAQKYDCPMWQRTCVSNNQNL
jgi:hypothetical protein